MTLHFYQFLIICPMVFLAGVVDAIAGGGGLISLPGYMIAGLPTHMAIATNKCSSSMGTSLATFRYARSGYIPWKLALSCVVFAMAGSSLGARLALLMSDFVFKIFMLIVLPLTAIFLMTKRDILSQQEPVSFGKSLLIGAMVALGIGVYDGFYGPGTGTFLILFLTGLAHLKLTEANGVTKVINLSTNLAALTVYLINGKVLLLLGITAGLFNIAGNYIGTRFFDKGGAKAVRPIMILVLVIFFVKVLLEVLQTAGIL